jgi:hypothetical protein
VCDVIFDEFDIFLYIFLVSFHHCNEFDVFFDAGCGSRSVPPRAVLARKPRMQARLNSWMEFQIWGSARVALNKGSEFKNSHKMQKRLTILYLEGPSY